MYFVEAKAVRSILVLFIVGIACLALYAFALDITRLHFFALNSAMNDQVGYIDTARHVLNESRLTRGLIYPSVLLQNYSYNNFYMPGHALVVALSLWLLGGNVLACLLPNILSYLLSIMLLYWIGARLANSTVGFITGFLFAIFSANIIFSVSAIAEMTFLCAGLIAFTIFLYLPIHLRFWLGSVLVCPPFFLSRYGRSLDRSCGCCYIE